MRNDASRTLIATPQVRDGAPGPLGADAQAWHGKKGDLWAVPSLRRLAPVSYPATSGPGMRFGCTSARRGRPGLPTGWPRSSNRTVEIGASFVRSSAGRRAWAPSNRPTAIHARAIQRPFQRSRTWPQRRSRAWRELRADELEHLPDAAEPGQVSASGAAFYLAEELDRLGFVARFRGALAWDHQFHLDGHDIPTLVDQSHAPKSLPLDSHVSPCPRRFDAAASEPVSHARGTRHHSTRRDLAPCPENA